MNRRLLWTIIGVVVVVFLGLQLVQVVSPAFSHTNPPVTNDVNWDSQQTQQLWARTCQDCHSNETEWPAYSYVAPISFYVVSHVKNGRSEVNVSTGGELEGGEMAEVIREGHNPLQSYQITHPEARLTDAERNALAEGLIATFGGEGANGEAETEAEEEEEEEFE